MMEMGKKNLTRPNNCLSLKNFLAYDWFHGFQEIMHDPHIAADGFTYEGEAIRAWLENGRETSPMTNLNLEHLHLTSNHALRHAIQDWLCRS